MSSAIDLAAAKRWADSLAAYRLITETNQAALTAAIEHAHRGGLDVPAQPVVTILLLGATGVGKSAVINALAGAVIAETGHRRPTTGRPLVYLHEQIPASQLHEYGLGEAGTEEQPLEVVRHHRPELRDKIIIDTPDIDSYAREHRQRVLSLLPAVDIVLYVVSPEKYKDDTGWQLLLRERGKRAFAFVMNKWDSLGKLPVPDGAKDVDDDFREMLQLAGYESPRLFRMSAEYWVGRAMGADGPPPAGDRFPALVDWLTSGLGTNDVAVIQSYRRAVLLGELGSAMEAALPVDLAAHSWTTAARQELDALEQAGHGVIASAVEPLARQMTGAYGLRPLPGSPGPLGVTLRITDALGKLVTGFNGRGRGRGGEVTDSASGGVFLPERLARLDESRRARVEIAARADGIPVNWLLDRWHARAEGRAAWLEDEIAGSAAAAATRPGNLARRVAGRAVMVVFEIALLAVLAIALWRLVEAFVAGSYLGLAFVATGVALFLTLLVLGALAVRAVSPPLERAVAQGLQQRLEQVWRELVDGERADLAALARETASAKEIGARLLESVDREQNRCTRTLRAAEAAGRTPLHDLVAERMPADPLAPSPS